MSDVKAYQCSNCGRSVNYVQDTVIGSYVNENNEEVFMHGNSYIFACECKAPVEEVNGN